MTPSTARELLERHGLAARRSLGQHFLVDPNTVRRIVRLAQIRPDEQVVEIGPGLGALTLALADAAARVVAIELDERMADVAREVLAGRTNVDVVAGDALRVPLPAGRLIANLPYNVATPILARVLDEAPQITGGLVMVQRELGERWTAPPGSKTYAAISVKVAYHATARIAAGIPRTVFLPPPKVDSVLVAFERRDRPAVDVGDPGPFFAFIERAFSQRRKTIRNTLRLDDYRGLDPGRRPETLTLEEFVRLYG